MKHFPNIERSSFNRREYVGYAAGRVYRVRKHGCGGWEAWLAISGGARAGYLHAPTLTIISAMLTAITTSEERADV